MNQDITGDHCLEQLPLLLYGELSFDEEERVEAHLAVCEACRVVWQQQRELSDVLDSIVSEPSPAMLRQARTNLFAQLERQPVAQSWWHRLIDFAVPQGPAPFFKPATALVLVAMGFVGARVAPGVLPSLALFGGAAKPDPGNGAGEMALADLSPEARVRYVERTADGRIQIVLDETRQRTVTGPMGDANIRGLLLAATRDPSDPGLRAETMGLLASGMQDAAPSAAQVAEEVKAALLYAIQDPNDGVRLKALEGLKAFAADAEVRATLSEVLLSDRNPAMRNQAIDLLMQGMENGLALPAPAGRQLEAPQRLSPADAHMVNLWQQLMRREEKNPYVRQRSQRALELVNAVQETY